MCQAPAQSSIRSAVEERGIRTADRRLRRRKTKALNLESFLNRFGALWSGTPDSNWRPSPWQGPPENLQPHATSVKPAESLADQQPAAPPLLSADAAKCRPATDAGLTPIPASPAGFLDSISDDRLFTVAQVAELLQIRKTDVYAACDKGHLAYVKLEGAVQIEGRDLKAWALNAHQSR